MAATDDSVTPDSPPAEPRSARWPWLAIAVVAAMQLAGLYTIIVHSVRPGSGLTLAPHPAGLPAVGPETRQAAELIGHLEPHVLLLEVNGKKLEKRTFSQMHAVRMFDTTPGAVNRVLLQDKGGTLHRVSLTAGPIHWPTLFSRYHWRFLYWVVGMLFFMLGVFVWRRAEGDRTAQSFLLFMLVAPAHGVLATYTVWPGPMLIYLQLSIFPFYGLGILDFALRFIGKRHEPRWRWVVWGFAAVCLALALAIPLSVGLMAGGGGSLEPVVRSILGINSVQLGLSVVTVFVLTLRVWRAPGPVGLRRRARVLGWATIVSFLFPAFWSSFGHGVPDEKIRITGTILQFLLLGVFPVMMGYAILRLHMFSLRVVMSKGVVYAALSVVVSLVYVGVILLVHHVAGSYRQLPLVSALSLMVFVVLFSLLKVRIQEAVDRVVFRSRYMYAEAVAKASARLARAQGINAVSRAVRLALVDGMRLQRVYLALWDTSEDEDTPVNLQTIPIEAGKDADSTRLPERFDPLTMAPVRRAIMERQATTAYDRQVFSEASTEGDLAEVNFWHHHGLECVTPLMGHEANARVVGLLLLGPKSTGDAMDPEDLRLLSTLSNQVAMAIENSLAFEQIRQLKENLEDQVAGRTSELTHTLVQLHETQAQLIEHQTNAMLARVVAGVVHEVNSPLGVIHSSSDTVQRIFDRCRTFVRQEQAQAEEAGDAALLKAAKKLLRTLDKGSDVLGTLDASSKRITDVINSLQKFVSLDEAEYKTVDVRDSLETTLLLLSPRLEGKVEISRDFGDEPTRVSCYPAQLNQVFLKLLENGIDAVDSKGRLTITLSRRGRWVVVRIADNGRGISKKQMAKLFEFGFTRKSGGRIGMRMGLAYCKSTIDKFGGRLKIDSAEGEGTTVTVQLLAAQEGKGMKNREQRAEN